MKLRILIADDEEAARRGMAKALARTGHEILTAVDGNEARKIIEESAPELVFLDLNMPGAGGLDVLRALAGQRLRSEIIVVTANDTVQTAVECVRLGAADYITKPYEIEQLRAIVRRVEGRIALETRVEELSSQLDAQTSCGALVGVSRPMRQLFEQIAKAARAPLDVLVRGETGVGKELIARELHRQSPRAAGPFVAINTAAVTESLAESELFGHVRGAFTGAIADRQGVFEQGRRGTLFLDEIGDMPRPIQVKLLRALQERAIQPVGSTKRVEIDVRVVCATHCDLAQAVEAGDFRQDLYYRVKGIELVVPPLRQRREDIPLLANYFLERLARQTGAAPRSLSPGAIDQMLAYAWPGNVRELEHLILAAASMADGNELSAADLSLPPQLESSGLGDSSAWLELPLAEAKARLVENFERAAITAALEKHAGNVSAAARQLGMHRQNLQQKLTQLGISRAGE
ncbi:MAG TPA: sigma-54 dependent transcriptional regulator [Pirellulales bacterium]|jgi:DNA-binding NtrC family response regulator